MKLTIDFSALEETVRRMGADSMAIDFKLDQHYKPPDPIDIQLKEHKIEVTLDEVEFIDEKLQLASYKGWQVLLYIQDHGSNVVEALLDGAKGNRFHVANCRTLRTMKEKGRFERYVVTNDLSGNFKIYGNKHGKKYEGETHLQICKNCLSHLRYKGYPLDKENVETNFSIEEFFATYSAYFSTLPSRMAGINDSNYTEDWNEISRKFRTAKNWQCEICGVNLKDRPNSLHVHHKNGVKIDNREENLQVLCIDCHSKQPMHSHIRKK